MAQEVERHAKIIDDPVIAEYVNRVGQNLVRNSDSKVPFTIKMVDSQEINAFALPGGFFFVNSGLFLRADNEAELAGVMAHEIAHAKRSHVARSIEKATVPDLLAKLVVDGLGHVHVADTQWYLSGSPELMREAMRRLEQRWGEQP